MKAIFYTILWGALKTNPEVRKNKLSTWGKIASFLPLGKLGNSINAHLLSKFVGGVFGYKLGLY